MAKTNRLRILVVDDHPVVRKGIAAILDRGLDSISIKEAGDAQEGMKEIEAAPPDLVITDISLPGMNGIEFVKQIAARWPEMYVLVLTRHDEEMYAERALRAGARGFVMKNEADVALIEAVGKIRGGGVYLSKHAKALILTNVSDLDHSKTALERLSDRELEVYEHIGHGATRADIARSLNLSVKTVDSYRSRLKEKLGFQTTAQLMQSAVQWVQAAS